MWGPDFRSLHGVELHLQSEHEQLRLRVSEVEEEVVSGSFSWGIRGVSDRCLGLRVEGTMRPTVTGGSLTERGGGGRGRWVSCEEGLRDLDVP